MLSVEELKEIAAVKSLTLQNAEKDYLQDLVLFAIYSMLGKELVFKGGTCLYKVYQMNRFSEDLDFTQNGKVKPEKLADGIVKRLALVGIRSRVKEIRAYGNEITIRMLVTGPLYNGSPESICFLPVSISRREKVLLPPKAVLVAPLYREIPSFNIFPMEKEEIAAEKIRAVLTRAKPRDAYDLWFLVKKLGVMPDIAMVNRKLHTYKLKFDKNALFKKLQEFEGMWNTDLKGLNFGQLPDFGQVVKEIIESYQK